VDAKSVPLHYVCTRDEARELVQGIERLWVSNCGCRERRAGCKRSRVDVCLMFQPEFSSTDAGVKPVSADFVDELLREAETKHLVTRPFRGFENRSRTDGICFCCDDCCGYFLDDDEPCDKGASKETTDLDQCTHCGLCVDVCYFRARSMKDGGLVVREDACYGCGLCVDVCPESCVRMVPRT